MTSLLETTAYRAPLALAPLDAATGTTVSDGLVASAWPVGDPSAAVSARPSPYSPLLGFPLLPGLATQEFAFASGNAAPQWPAADPKHFLVAVVDTQQRYLPQLIAVDVPVSAPVAVLLYSAPARPARGGAGVVAGEVHLEGGTAPAAWALVAISDGTTHYEAVCDTMGRYRLLLPYPEALPPLLDDPPHGTGLANVSWPLAVKVFYQPTALSFPGSPAPGGPPEIGSIRAQAASQIVTSGGPQPSVNAVLRLGPALILPLQVTPA